MNMILLFFILLFVLLLEYICLCKSLTFLQNMNKLKQSLLYLLIVIFKTIYIIKLTHNTYDNMCVWNEILLFVI